MAAYWWADDSSERFWVEIRAVEGIGTSLWCPDHQQNEGRPDSPNPWYELVASVRDGDTIYHYNEREKRFVGRSVAAEDAKHDRRERFYEVELRDFRPIAASIDLAHLRSKSSTLYALREALRAAHPGQTVYSPFQFRGTALYGMMSNYFAKLPQDVVLELFGTDGLAEGKLPIVPEDGTGARADDLAPGPVHGGFLKPFSPKADSDYWSRSSAADDRARVDTSV